MLEKKTNKTYRPVCRNCDNCQRAVIGYKSFKREDGKCVFGISKAELDLIDMLYPNFGIKEIYLKENTYGKKEKENKEESKED